MASWDIPNEDRYWEDVRERMENPRRRPWWDDEPVYETGTVYLDDTVDEIEAENGCSMSELYEGDLLEIVERFTGIVADSAKWDEAFCGIDYRYEADAAYA